MAKMEFNSLLHKLRGEDYKVPKRVLAFDPGETTGWAYFTYGTLKEAGQISVPVVNEVLHAEEFFYVVTTTDPDVVVVEDYRVYASKAQPHSWNALYTPKLIGYIQAVCHSRFEVGRQPKMVMQMASSKQFCTNDKLKAWGFYQKANPHANDAVRHGCYYLLFHGRRQKK